MLEAYYQPRIYQDSNNKVRLVCANKVRHMLGLQDLFTAPLQAFQYYNIYIIFIITIMDKTFNFFKSKNKKQAEKARNSEKSNSSKASSSKYSNKPKQHTHKMSALSQKEIQIRAAIQTRYQRSKLRNYRFQLETSDIKRQISSSHSSNTEEYQHLKRLRITDIRQYHQRQSSLKNSQSNSKERPTINLKLKLGGTSLRTENDDLQRKPLGHSIKALNKNATPENLCKKEKWRFITLQGKENCIKPKTRKPEIKINSHRSYTVHEGSKLKPNSSLQKGLDKAKSKEANKVALNRF